MSRLNEIKKIRYKLDNANSLELSREKIEFLCDWAEKGIVAISKTETTSCEWCESKTIPLFYVECVRATLDDESQLISASYCPACGRKLD